ncbi:hypothetical protein [Catellatospora tritici]|uniref:hypothetical protein n=1 Tax=Catellatospora tritici TaxID=2851566 RepID=UPI001C2CE521|nr:hypothetical protein [Catellatospora tritici]MBV1855460.1 hypothetical protein [Catellatospora tritici]
MGAYHLRKLIEAKQHIDGSYGYWGTGGLLDGIDDGLSAPHLTEFYGIAANLADRLREYAKRVDAQAVQTHTLASRKLDAAVVGQMSVPAADGMKALEGELKHIVDVLGDAADVLTAHAAVMVDAAREDGRGVEQLRDARARVADIDGFFDYDGDVMRAAHRTAMDGVNARVHAHTAARDSADRVTRTLNDLTSSARLAKLGSSPLRALDELMIANAGADEFHGVILTAAAADRAQQRLNGLSEADRAALLALLAAAKSPYERAYLLKALAAGYGVGELTKFDQQIHDHGDDPAWLDRHLAPLDTSANPVQGAHTSTMYDGKEWTQGQYPTCVASSTVTARAQVDPLYALQLTTGGHPGDPAFDNPDAFAARLRDEQERVYDGGRNIFQKGFGVDGMADWQSTSVADEEIGAHTGIDYHDVKLGDGDARRDVLTEVEKAVDNGLPVPVSVSDDWTPDHQMMIVGHDGGMLQIYNPWGYTVWVSEEDFINGHLDNAVDKDVPPTPISIRVPR